MIFGRKDKADQAAEPTQPESAEASETVAEQEPEAAEPEELRDELADLWASWDADFDRDEGPFDIAEVDLEADEVSRLDLGSLILTPFEEMTLQLQVDQASNQVQAILVGDGSSALEVAVFAGPARSSMLAEVRSDLIAGVEAESGSIEVVAGPFGAELRRRMPVTDERGNPAMHISRLWLVGGPGWLLRGTLMGKGALEPDNEAAYLALFEFFSNLVVRRGSEPAAPGSLLAMSVPELES